MGWFSKSKMEGEHPPPERKTFSDEKTLFFPSRSQPLRRIIEPEQVKAAAGLERPLPLEEPRSMPALPPLTLREEMPEPPAEGSLYVKVDVYQRILGEVDDLRRKLDRLQEVNKGLETSEYNEDTDFVKLRRTVKNLHDRTLQIDKVLFKA